MTKQEVKDIACTTLYVVLMTAICYAVLVVFGSCGVSHMTEAQGRTVVITTDTTVVNHTGYIKIQK